MALIAKKPFWVVWNPRGGYPKVRHRTLAEAAAEAERLSKEVPGRHFYVLEALGFAMTHLTAQTRVT
jgi:hypothetical protein